MSPPPSALGPFWNVPQPGSVFHDYRYGLVVVLVVTSICLAVFLLARGTHTQLDYVDDDDQFTPRKHLTPI